MDRVGRDAILRALESTVAVLGGEFRPDPRGVPRDFSLTGVSTAETPKSATVVFLRKPSTSATAGLSSVSGCLLILPVGMSAGDLRPDNVMVFADNPKYAYALVATALFPIAEWRGILSRPIGPSSWAAENSTLEEGVLVEPFVTIGGNSRIGAGTILMRGVSIGPNVEIGRDCLVRENAVVGDLGFGFAFDGKRPPLRIPQLGGARLGDRVEIGALSTVGAGTMEPTVIEDDVKISDHVHIAHNCRIGSRTIIACGASVSGSSSVGIGCWLSPETVVRNKIRIGDGAVLGMGAVVVKDVEAGVVVAGVPAKPFSGGTDPRG